MLLKISNKNIKKVTDYTFLFTLIGIALFFIYKLAMTVIDEENILQNFMIFLRSVVAMVWGGGEDKIAVMSQGVSFLTILPTLFFAMIFFVEFQNLNLKIKIMRCL